MSTTTLQLPPAELLPADVLDAAKSHAAVVAQRAADATALAEADAALAQAEQADREARVTSKLAGTVPGPGTTKVLAAARAQRELAADELAVADQAVERSAGAVTALLAGNAGTIGTAAVEAADAAHVALVALLDQVRAAAAQLNAAASAVVFAAAHADPQLAKWRRYHTPMATEVARALDALDAWAAERVDRAHQPVQQPSVQSDDLDMVR